MGVHHNTLHGCQHQGFRKAIGEARRITGTRGFPTELLLILSALASHTGAGLAALFGAELGAGYFLGLYRRAVLGPVAAPAVAGALGR